MNSLRSLLIKALGGASAAFLTLALMLTLGANEAHAFCLGSCTGGTCGAPGSGGPPACLGGTCTGPYCPCVCKPDTTASYCGCF